MGAENLGYLAQLLGGMQQGKLLRQKKELSAAQLEARKAEAEQRKFDRAATAGYRQQQLDLQRANLNATLARNEREALGLDDMFKLGTATRDKIASTVAARQQDLDRALTPKEYESIIAGTRASVQPDIESIRTLARDPNIAKKFPGFDPKRLESLWLAGVPEWARNPDVSPGMPDFKARYKPTSAQQQFNLNVQRLREANVSDPTVYVNAALPAYQKIMDDLQGVEGAAEYALATLGPIPMLSLDDTMYVLKTGRLPGQIATPDQMSLKDVQTSELGGAFDQSGLPLRFGNELQAALPGTAMPTDIDYFQRAYPQLFDPSSYTDLGDKPLFDEQGQSNYVRTGRVSMPAGISLKTQTEALLQPERLRAAKADATYKEVSLPERLRKLGLENEKAIQALEIGDIDKRSKVAKAFMDELKAANFPEILRADLENKITTALKNKAGIITGLKNWEANAQKNYGMAVSTAASNLVKANATVTNNMNITSALNNPEYASAITTYLNDLSPTAVIPGNIAIEIGAGGVAALRDLKVMRIAYEKAKKAQESFEAGGVLPVRNIMERLIGTIGGTGSSIPRISAPTTTPAPTAPARGGGGARSTPPATGGGVPRIPRPQPN